MALIKCPKCGSEIEETAKKCIHCGCKLKKGKKAKKTGWIIAIILLLAIAAVVVYEGNNLRWSEETLMSVISNRSYDCLISHTWTPATCTEPMHCTGCGLHYDETLEAHAWIDATCTEPKTCSACGTTEGEALGHTVDAGVCSRCNKIINEDVIYSILSYFTRAQGKTDCAYNVIKTADTSSVTDLYIKMESAQEYIDSFRSDMQAIINKCGSYSGLSELKSIAQKMKNAAPSYGPSCNSNSEISWLTSFKNLLTSVSNNYSELAEFTSELAKASN